MKLAFEFFVWFTACIFVVLGFSGIKAVFTSFKENKRSNKMLPKG